MRFKKKYWTGIGVGLFIMLLDVLVFLKTKWFLPIFIVGLSVAWGQFWLDLFLENQRQKELEERFVDFVRNLSGAIKSGMPVPRAILHVADYDYGPLTRHTKKLGHKIEWAIPVHSALISFSKATKSDVIRRSIATVIEAEKSGGNMENVLESIVVSLVEIKKIRQTRRSSTHSQIVQSYIIFFVFLGVMIVIQNLLLPYLVNAPSAGGLSFGSGIQSQLAMAVKIQFSSVPAFVVTFSEWMTSLRGIFLMLSLIQGFFAGLIIGKLSEGDILSGFKHSLILSTIAFLVMTIIG